jgi:hypothetical protein
MKNIVWGGGWEGPFKSGITGSHDKINWRQNKFLFKFLQKVVWNLCMYLFFKPVFWVIENSFILT